MNVDITPDRARSPSSSDLVEWVREGIRRGRFVPGQRLVEVDIIRQTGATRSKVREALQRLEGEGLVEIEEFRGASVRTASLDEVRHIYRARMALEGISVVDFIKHASDAQKTRLADLQAELELCVTQNAPERFGRLNTEWHNLIVEGSANVVIAEVLQRLNVPIHRLLFDSFYSAERLKTAIADHARILAAIKAEDTAAAEAAMRQHIEDGFATMAHIDSEYHR
jgi:DNA-binding GntR family transcriptional regulator